MMRYDIVWYGTICGMIYYGCVSSFSIVCIVKNYSQSIGHGEVGRWAGGRAGRPSVHCVFVLRAGSNEKKKSRAWGQ